jgi:hypothetical protein
MFLMTGLFYDAGLVGSDLAYSVSQIKHNYPPLTGYYLCTYAALSSVVLSPPSFDGRGRHLAAFVLVLESRRTEGVGTYLCDGRTYR